MASLNLLRKLRDRIGTAATWLGDRFRTAAGAILGRKETSALVTRTVDLAAAAHLAPLAEQVASGSITIDAWLAAMRTEVKNLYFTQYVIARGGLGQMTFADWGRLGAMLKDQYGYLDGFAEYIKANSPSAAYIAMRARLYADASHEAFERARTLIALERGADEVSWHIDPAAENCSDCIDWEAMGWQPIGPRGGFPSPKGEAWPGSGLSKCLVRCRCSTAYRNSQTGEVWAEVAEYDPNQPRVPAGDSEGGQWTAVGGAGGIGGLAPNTYGRGHAPTDGELASIHRHSKKNQGKQFLDSVGMEITQRPYGPHNDAEYGEVKAHIVKTLAERTGYSEQQIQAVIDVWSETAADHSLKALEMQYAIGIEFGMGVSKSVTTRLNDASRVRYSVLQTKPDLTDSSVSAQVSFWDTEKLAGTDLRKIARGMYDYTQESFRAKGILPNTQLTFIRGTATNTLLKEGSVHTVFGNPVQSWSASWKTGELFSEINQTLEGRKYAITWVTTVPASRVFSTTVTGLGSYEEQEFVLFSGTQGNEAELTSLVEQQAWGPY